MVSALSYGQNVGDIIITEIMQNPSTVADTNGEWFELYNTTDSAIDLDGWVIKDDGTNTHTISGTLVVPAKEFKVLGIKSDVSINGGVSINYK